MAIKKISQFTSGTPTDNDYILFEQNGAGKSAKFGDFSLSYEEIMASTDLSGKVSSANALKELGGTDWVQVSANIRCKKIGNVKFAQVKAIDGGKQTWINIGTLPAEYRPLNSVKCTFSTNSSLGGIGTCVINIYGTVRIWCANSEITSSDEYNINLMYM